MKRTARQITYVHGDHTILEQVSVMWSNLNHYHCQRSAHFKDHYLAMTFEKRKEDLLKKSERGEMRVDLAVDSVTGQAVGYVISSVNDKLTGEIESVFVEADYRGMGVGGKLMVAALAWMEQKGAQEKIVEVSIGNEHAWGFYGRFGFLPRKTVLKQVKKR